MEAYLLEIEERSETLYDRIVGMGGGPLSFFDLLGERSFLEVVRVFMMLLFLGQMRRVELYQDEEENDIIVKIRENEEDE
jgi:chromatin segregation and condensation protein Rec8/ScpA/Scc1 (kleisin family)